MVKVQKAKAKNTRKAGNNKKSKRSFKKMDFIQIWMRRIFVSVSIFIVILWVGTWFFLTNSNISSSNWLKVKVNNIVADLGFVVKNISIEGQKYTDTDILKALINIEEGDPIFSLNPNEAKEQIEKIGWVKFARVERHLPDTIYIYVKERQAMALWKDNEGLYLIDVDGNIITNKNLDRFKNLIMVSGENSNKKAYEFISILKSEPDLLSMTDNIKLIDNRRWNIYLDDGKLIKLPENNVKLAIRNIMLHDIKNNILKNDSIYIIDARHKGRLVIRTKLGKVQEYKAQLEH